MNKMILVAIVLANTVAFAKDREPKSKLPCQNRVETCLTCNTNPANKTTVKTEQKGRK
jgi:hypothetical protein